MKRVLAQISLTMALAGSAYSQSNEPLPKFDAADIHTSPKSANPNTAGGFIRGGRYQFRQATMVDLIASAYGVDADKILGGPSWLESDRFDILAKAPTSTSNDTAKLMLQSLLAERFKLVLHKDDKPVSSYVLTVGKGGSKMKESTTGATDCRGVPQNPAPGTIPYQVVQCTHMTAAALAQVLPQLAPAYLDRPVTDMTQLTGMYDFELKWTGRGQLAAAGSDGISVFDAVDKQLGLKLELQNRALPVVVVDSANRKPSDNSPDALKNLPVVPTEFEVADFKPSPPGAQQRGNIQPGGRIDLQSFPIRQMIQAAWDVPEDMIVGPKIMETARFDLIAKAPSDVAVTGINIDVDTLRAMLRATLIERFKIQSHMEDRSVDVYALVAPRKETRMKKADPSARSVCKRATPPPGTPAALSQMISCQNMTMSEFGEKLRGFAGGYITHPSIDLTGIEGGWDFTLAWTPRGAFEAAARPEGQPQPGGGGAPSSDPNGGLTVFEAIEKQLGLKMELQKHPMPVLVIDHIEEKPTEN
jgi:uncharacterized protein (TIGR03435 family)